MAKWLLYVLCRCCTLHPAVLRQDTQSTVRNPWILAYPKSVVNAINLCPPHYSADAGGDSIAAGAIVRLVQYYPHPDVLLWW